MQLSVLRIFQAILSDKAFKKQDGAREVIHLATHVSRNLFVRLVPAEPVQGRTRSPLLLDSNDLLVLFCKTGCFVL